MTGAEPDDDAFWVASEVPPANLMPGATAQYAVTVTARGVVLPLTRQTGLAYCATVMEAAARAEYDQVVYAHLHSIFGDHRQALNAVMELREDRAPLDDTATAPFRFEPLVLSKTLRGAVNGYVRGDPVTQWEVADARQHALHVLDVVSGVDLDTAYHRYLRGVVGLDGDRCLAAVGALRRHRPDDGYVDQRAPLPAGPVPAGPRRTPLGLLIVDQLPRDTPPPPNRAGRRRKGGRR